VNRSIALEAILDKYSLPPAGSAYKLVKY
jgi:hypothetical protein